MTIEVRVPPLGESVSEATVATWFKKPGDPVALDEMLCELETDKVTVEVAATAAGTLGEIVASEGSTVGANALLATITEGAAPARTQSESDKAIAKTSAKAGPEETVAKATPAAQAAKKARDPEDAPSAKKAMAEAGISRDQVTGTGRDGRVMKDDVARAGSAPAPAAAPEPAAQAPRAPVAADDAAREERVKMTRLRQTIARRLKSAQEEAALLTTFNDVDMTAVIEAREAYKDLFAKKHGIKLGFMSFFAKASCLALKDVPSVNAYIEGDEIVYHDYVDISVAVSAPNGLVVPVVRDADRMTFAEIEKAIAAFGKKAKEGTLTADDMKGGTFTISNGGVFGSLLSTPIINPPQSAVLGMHRIEERPVVKDGQVVARPMMYLALSYDHRLVDGREAVTFLVRVKEAIEDPTRLLIDL
jgi:2-oxoglutarate dehydrogenase E2 component (dihydrolipoamide succinyltransferase)